MTTTTALDAACLCTCAKVCHHREMRWGQTVYARCRHHIQCPMFRPAGETAVGDPLVLDSYESHACLTCGRRYGFQFTDHPCGLLVPVTVLIVPREVIPA